MPLLHRFSLLMLLLLFACKSNAPVVEQIPNKALQDKMDFLVQDNDLPGMNFAWIGTDGRMNSYSSGLEDKEKNQALNDKHVLFSGSIGKTYAVALLMQLVEAGEVDLQAKWKSYFPDIDWIDRLPNIDEISVEYLLQHRSGLPRYVMKMAAWDSLAANPDKIWSYEDRMALIFDDDPVHEAGNGWAYSDTNYILIGMLIERVTGKPYYELVKARLLDEFGLKETHPGTRRDIPNLAMAYSRLPAAFSIPEKVVENGKYVFNPQLEWTGGGMASSTPDLARWAKVYFEAKTFSPESLKKITTVNPDGEGVDAGDSYGMGAFIYKSKIGEAFGHSGFMPGFNSLFVYLPKQKVAAALQINCDYASQKMGLTSYMEVLLETALAENTQ